MKTEYITEYITYDEMRKRIADLDFPVDKRALLFNWAPIKEALFAAVEPIEDPRQLLLDL